MTSPAEAGRWLAALGDDVAEVEVEGWRGWMLAEDVEEAAAAAPEGVVRLLPGFDHYVVAAPRDVDAVLRRGAARRRVPAAGLALAGGAPRWTHGRHLGPHAEVRCIAASR